MLLELAVSEWRLSWRVNDGVSGYGRRIRTCDRLLPLHHHHHLPVLSDNLLQKLVLLCIEHTGIQVLLELLKQEGVLLPWKEQNVS